MESKILDSYYNDGYVYCFLSGLTNVNNKNLVKIGKTQFKATDTEQQTMNGLLRRYSTYYPDFEVIHFLRVGNCHLAELKLFELLKNLHYHKEHYIFDKDLVNNAFNQVSTEFPNIQDLITSVDINTSTRINKIIRSGGK